MAAKKYGEGAGESAPVDRIVHTPGPWVQHKKNGRVIVAGEVRIATAANTSNPPVAWRNASVIAEAPEMLQLLEDSCFSIGGDWRKKRDDLLARIHREVV